MQPDPHGGTVIAFVSQDDNSNWIEALSNAMPNEFVVADQQLSDDEARAVEIVVVANPDPARLARYKNVQWIQSVWVGVERLLPITAERNVPLVRLIDPVLAHTMGEAVLAWTLYLHRDMPAYAAQQRNQQWQQRPYRPAGELTVGLLGLGELGQAAAKRLVAAGYRVCGWSRHAKQIEGVMSYSGADGLERMLKKADVLVVLLPLTTETTNLLSQRYISMMPAGAALINFSRGPVVDADALVAALDVGTLSHAVLDVFAVEPLPAQNILWRHPKITVLPHISAPTNQQSASQVVASNVAKFRTTGDLPVIVDTRRGY